MFLIKSFSLSDSPALTMMIQVVLKGGRLAAMKFFRTEQDDDGRWEKKGKSGEKRREKRRK